MPAQNALPSPDSTIARVFASHDSSLQKLDCSGVFKRAEGALEAAANFRPQLPVERVARAGAR